MNRNIIYTILLIFIVATVFLSYGSITTKLENTKLTQVNTKSQPCPDYWINKGGQKCDNQPGLGNGSCAGEHNFSAKKYQGLKGRKERCKFAKQCEI